MIGQLIIYIFYGYTLWIHMKHCVLCVIAFKKLCYQFGKFDVEWRMVVVCSAEWRWRSMWRPTYHLNLTQPLSISWRCCLPSVSRSSSCTLESPLFVINTFGMVTLLLWRFSFASSLELQVRWSLVSSSNESRWFLKTENFKYKNKYFRFKLKI